MDFMSDVLSVGTRFRTLNIVDDFSWSWECPAIKVTGAPLSFETVSVHISERFVL